MNKPNSSVNNLLLIGMMNRMCERAAQFLGESFYYNWQTAISEISASLTVASDGTCRNVFGQLAGWMVFDREVGIANLVPRIDLDPGSGGDYNALISGVGTLIAQNSLDADQLRKGMEWSSVLRRNLGGSPLAALEFLIFRQETDCHRLTLDAALQFTGALAMVPLSSAAESVQFAERVVDCHAMAVSCSNLAGDFHSHLGHAYLRHVAELHRLMACISS